MKPIARFLSGSLLGAALFATGLSLQSETAWAQQQTDIKLGCSGGTCCTYNGTTGQIYDCHSAG